MDRYFPYDRANLLLSWTAKKLFLNHAARRHRWRKHLVDSNPLYAPIWQTRTQGGRNDDLINHPLYESTCATFVQHAVTDMPVARDARIPLEH